MSTSVLPGASQAVREVDSGAEGDLWEMLMGEQIHVGGFRSSQRLAERARLGAGMQGVDLCCCTGAGMRFLVRIWGVARMWGGDFTRHVIELCSQRCKAEGMADQISFIETDAISTCLPGQTTDFGWGEDAWCNGEGRFAPVAEAAKLVCPGVMVAFTDWVMDPVPLERDAYQRFLKFMKYPNVSRIEQYTDRLRHCGWVVVIAKDIGQFVSHCQLYLNMVSKQLTYEALKLWVFDMRPYQTSVINPDYLQLAQGMFVANKQ